MHVIRWQPAGTLPVCRDSGRVGASLLGGKAEKTHRHTGAWPEECTACSVSAGGLRNQRHVIKSNTRPKSAQSWAWSRHSMYIWCWANEGNWHCSGPSWSTRHPQHVHAFRGRLKWAETLLGWRHFWWKETVGWTVWTPEFTLLKYLVNNYYVLSFVRRTGVWCKSVNVTYSPKWLRYNRSQWKVKLKCVVFLF